MLIEYLSLIILIVLIRAMCIDYKSYCVTNDTIYIIIMLSIIYNIYLFFNNDLKTSLFNIILSLIIYSSSYILNYLYNKIFIKNLKSNEITNIYIENIYNKKILNLLKLLGIILIFSFCLYMKLKIKFILISFVFILILCNIFKKENLTEKEIKENFKNEEHIKLEIIGYGDVLILTLLTSIYGLKGFIVILIYSCYIQIIVIILYYFFSKQNNQYKCTPFIIGICFGFFMYIMKFNILELYELVNLFF